MKHKSRKSLKHLKHSNQWKNNPRVFSVISHADFGEDNTSFSSLTCRSFNHRNFLEP